VFEFSLRTNVSVIKISMKSKLSQNLILACPRRRRQILMLLLEKRVTRHRDFDCRPSSRMKRFPRVESEHNLFRP